jgi:hypothetical protein
LLLSTIGLFHSPGHMGDPVTVRMCSGFGTGV